MRKALLLCVALGSAAISMHGKTPPKAVDFSGKWVLDTGQTKNVPDGLASYTMAVEQNNQRLIVETKLTGNLRTIDTSDETSPQTRARVGPPGGYPGGEGPVGPEAPVGGIGGPEVPVGGAGTIGGAGVPVGPRGPIGGPAEMPVGGVGPSSGPGIPVGGGPMGEGIPGSTEPSQAPRGQSSNKRQARAALAFSVYPRNASYELGGGNSNVRLGDPDKEAAAKAAWTKGRRQLRVSLTGDRVTVKDEWKLSKDGRNLLIDRTVHAPAGSTSVHLVFEKQPAGVRVP